MARMTSLADSNKFDGIIHLKELCTYMDIVLKKLRQRPLFLQMQHYVLAMIKHKRLRANIPQYGLSELG